MCCRVARLKRRTTLWAAGPQSPSAAEQFPAGRLEGYSVAVKPVGLARRQFDLDMRAIIADIQRFLELGIDGGFTDYPALWKEAVKLEKKPASQKE